MSSSSSNSDSDDCEPVRRIQINIRPKEDATLRKVADVDEIKASVEAWRPLGPPVHLTLSKRQLSLSSMSSVSFNSQLQPNNQSSPDKRGVSQTNASIHSSPSCSSLVNEFNNRSSFSQFMSTTSRTSSPLTLMGQQQQYQQDTVPIAIAIQESIELVVKDHYDPDASEPKYMSRCMGNIKMAFPNSLAKIVCGSVGSRPVLRLRMHSNQNIIRYYGSRLIKDLDTETTTGAVAAINTAPISSHSEQHQTKSNISSYNGHLNQQMNQAATLTFDDDDSDDLFSSNKNLPWNSNQTSKNSKSIEFDMEVLGETLKKMYDQSPGSRYYNIDVLRYQIAPIRSIKESPLQVCAYWKVESNLIKLRIDFEHSSKSGLNLERLREISFTVSFSDFIPAGIEVQPITLGNNNNNNLGVLNMNTIESRPQQTTINLLDDFTLPSNNNLIVSSRTNGIAMHTNQPQKSTYISSQLPHITYEPKAYWNASLKQLIWKFDTLLSYHKTNGFGSLFAKLDFCTQTGAPSQSLLTNCKPKPVDVKFLVIDSSLSKVSISIDSLGYKMSLLKKEIRSGQYRSEPYVL